MPLTAIAIKNTKSKGKIYRLFDGGGMYLEVSPKGGKWWQLKYRINGKEKRVSLGVYPETTLETKADNGILTVTIPKQEVSVSRKITVKH